MPRPVPKPSREEKRQMRSTSRLFAVQALFQMEQSGQPMPEVREQFETHRFGAELDGETYSEGDVDLFRKTLSDALDRQGDIDKATDRALVQRWPLGRIDPTLRALFRAAGAEILASSTPPRVVITEYVDVAKAFFSDGKEPKFVNAVLDHMAREMKPEAFE
ncbi:transcription antitermination factor NusB [Pontivivens nitratireducens]|jgi:N utilization substance protein B|uniref:Transcription antitermination protein NusB n=1 Tax=Pontivivens nitratireducens TaxID=2758038 RepID=A0A6G7VNV1_9RHOB|nr:transcription antitermination factor NusB [Pontibrevibacter nitratireducens]QIK41684.1 transcription antitermination factor NusB [Pontibrevibacter nitratireducens]